MASNAVVCKEKSEKRVDKKRKDEKMKKGGKRKTNQDEKRGWHPNMQSSMLSSWLNSQTHKVEVLGTLHPQMLCF